MGYVDSRGIENFEVDCAVGINEHEVALWVQEGSLLGYYTNGEETDWKPLGPVQTSEGDKFRLNFDFEKRECTAYYNDKLLGKVGEELPQSIYLAASVCCEEAEFTTSRFETQWKLEEQPSSQ